MLFGENNEEVSKILAMATSMVLVGIGIFTNSATATSDAGETSTEVSTINSNETGRYENSQLGIMIKYPQSWKVFFEQTGEDCFDEINWCVVDFAPNSTTELGYGDIQLEIARTSFKDDCNCESLMDSVRYYYQQEVKSIDENPSFYDFEFIDDNQTMIARNNSAWQMEYKHSFNDTFDNRVYDVHLLKQLWKKSRPISPH